jgi:hypothetical protein
MNRCLSILLFAITCLSACNDNYIQLEKADAKKQIENYYKEHPDKLIGNTAFEAVIKGKDSGNNNIMFRLYINAGLLKRKEIKPNADSIYIYEVTEAGKPYLLKTSVSKNGYPILVIKTFDYYIAEITGIKYSPGKKEAAVYFTESINNLTPFGKEAADPAHKRYLIGFFRLDNNNWKFQRIEVDVDKY